MRVELETLRTSVRHAKIIAKLHRHNKYVRFIVKVEKMGFSLRNMNRDLLKFKRKSVEVIGKILLR